MRGNARRSGDERGRVAFVRNRNGRAYSSVPPRGGTGRGRAAFVRNMTGRVNFPVSQRGSSGRGRAGFTGNRNGKASFPVSQRGTFRGGFRNARGAFHRGAGRLLRSNTSSQNESRENYSSNNRQSIPNRMHGTMGRPNSRGRARGFNARGFAQPMRMRPNRQNDADLRGVQVYDHTRIGTNTVRLRLPAKFSNQLRGNVHKPSVPFTGNSHVRNHVSNGRPTYRGNFVGRKRQMPRFKNDGRSKGPVQKKRRSEYNPGEESRLEKIVFGSTSHLINNLPDEAIPEYIGHESDEDTDYDTEDSEEHQNSDLDGSDNDNVSHYSETKTAISGDEDSDNVSHNGEDKTVDSVDEDADNLSHNSEDKTVNSVDEDTDSLSHNSEDKIVNSVDQDDISEDQGSNVEEESSEDEGCNDTDDSDNLSNTSIRAAWVDEDDIKYTVSKAAKIQKTKIIDGSTETYYNELLENRFKKLVGTPKWAEFNVGIKQDTDEIEDEILKHSCHIGKSTEQSLPKTSIELKAMSLLNKQTHNEGPIISSMEFHPTSTVGLVAGSSGIVSIFQVDGVENNKLHSMFYRKFPISKAKFIREGTEILLGSQYLPHCHCYNLISGKTYKIPLPHGVTSMKRYEISPDGKLIALCGRTGEIYLLTTSSKELVGQLKMNAKCRALAFSPDSKTLISHGDSNEMYVWDVNSRSCLHRAIDDGCLSCESIAMSPNGQFTATGSKQGVVNVYETDTIMKQDVPTPLKIVLNLVTPITSVKFNPTTEILAMASHKKPNAFKMMHIPSFNIFPNFPTNQTRLNMPEAIEFSPGGGYLGISNRSHSAFLFRLKHYKNY